MSSLMLLLSPATLESIYSWALFCRGDHVGPLSQASAIILMAYTEYVIGSRQAECGKFPS